jgi:hypothetical protein
MRLIALELFKLRTQRAMTVILLFAFLFSALSFIAGAISLNSGVIPGFGLSDAIAQRQLLSAGGGTTLILVFAVMGITGEYRHRTITSTFLGTPERHRVLLAKLFAYMIVAVAFGAVVACIVTGATLAFLSVQDVTLAVGWGQIFTDYLWELAGMALYAGFGLGIGGVIANQVAAIVLVLVEPIGSSILTGLLPKVGRYTPNQAAAAFGREIDGGVLGGIAEGMLSRATGGLLFLGYVVLFLALAIFITRKRDIT